MAEMVYNLHRCVPTQLPLETLTTNLDQPIVAFEQLVLYGPIRMSESLGEHS
jgi:hypothetical protein